MREIISFEYVIGVEIICENEDKGYFSFIEYDTEDVYQIHWHNFEKYEDSWVDMAKQDFNLIRNKMVNVIPDNWLEVRLIYTDFENTKRGPETTTHIVHFFNDGETLYEKDEWFKYCDCKLR